MRALLLGVCLLAAACGQSTQAPAEGDAAAPAFELPIQYQPFRNASDTAAWFVCDTVGGSRIFVATPPDDTGAFELREYEKGQAAPARTLRFTLFNDPAIGNPNQFSFREDDGLITFNATFAEAYSIPVDIVGVGLEGGEGCRLQARTYLTAFTANRSFVIRGGPGENEYEYLGYDASNWQDAGLEQAADGSRTNTPSVRAVGARTQWGQGTLQYEFPAGSQYVYRVTEPASGEATLEALRNGEVVTTEPIIAMQLGSRS